MKKLLSIALAVCMAAGCLFAFASCKKEETLTVYTEAGFAPFEYVKDGKIVGVDVDQSFESDTVVTSAMKGLADATKWAIAKVYDGTWSEIGGKATSLGVNENAVGLPTATWSFENFSVEDYNALLASMKDGKVKVDNDYTKLAADLFANVKLSIVE